MHRHEKSGAERREVGSSVFKKIDATIQQVLVLIQEEVGLVLGQAPRLPKLLEHEKCATVEELTRAVSMRLVAVFVGDIFRRSKRQGHFLIDRNYEVLAQKAVEQWLGEYRKRSIDAIADCILAKKGSFFMRSQLVSQIIRDRVVQVLNTLEERERLAWMMNEGLLYTPLPAEDLSARRITDLKDAPRLLERRNSLMVADDIVQVMLALRDRGDEKPYEQVLERVRLGGGFLQQYTLSSLQRRIDDPLYIMFEGSGRKTIAPGKRNGLIAGADIQIQLAADAWDAPCICTFPDEEKGDMYLGGKSISRYIQRNPSGLAIVQDICCERRMAHRGLASTARQAAYRYIFEEVNPRRGCINRIRFILSEIFSVHGFWEGDDYFCLSKGFPPIVNYASRLAHLQSKHCPADAAWTRRERLPVVVDQRDWENHRFALDVEWYATILELTEQVREQICRRHD